MSNTNNEFVERLASLTDDELVETFNNDVKKRGWVAARGRFLSAIRSEFKRRNIDFSILLEGNSFKLRRVKLINNKLHIQADQEKRKYYCPDCKHEVTRVPLTNYLNEAGDSIHIPYFGRAKCGNCPWQSEPLGRGLLVQYDATI